MNFKEIIKQEWEAEFPTSEVVNEEVNYLYEESIFLLYEQMVERICVTVWNQALEVAADNAEADYTMIALEEELEERIDIEVYVIKNSILKHKL